MYYLLYLLYLALFLFYLYCINHLCVQVMFGFTGWVIKIYLLGAPAGF